MAWRDWWSQLRRWWAGREEMEAPEAPPRAAGSPVEPDFRELLAASPEVGVGGELERAARACYRRGNYQECVELAQRALSYDASNLFAYHYLGLALARLGRWDKAEETFRRAQEHADTLDLTREWLGRLAEWRQRGEIPFEAAAEEDESWETEAIPPASGRQDPGPPASPSEAEDRGGSEPGAVERGGKGGGGTYVPQDPGG